MQGEVYSIYHLALEPSKFPAFKELISRIVAATSKESDTLTHEYVVNEDHTTVHILERYRAAGLLPHVKVTFAPFAEEFFLDWSSPLELTDLSGRVTSGTVTVFYEHASAVLPRVDGDFAVQETAPQQNKGRVSRVKIECISVEISGNRPPMPALPGRAIE